jgi:DNA-binding NtrC family response regulator
LPEDARRGRILVIEDEESLRHALRKGLARAGYDVRDAETGREGVALFGVERFDAVLADVKLPDLSGLDVLAILTEMDATVPVVIMTGHGTMDIALEAMRRGAKDYVPKPFTLDEVVRALDKSIPPSRAEVDRRLRAKVERQFAPDGYRKVEEELRARNAVTPQDDAPAASPTPPAQPPPLDEARRTFEIRYVEDLLTRTGGNVAAAARLAGISRPNFHKKLRALGVDPVRFKRAARRGRQA